MHDPAQRRVLVVEDDPTHLTLMADAVRSLGVGVEEAVTASSALAALARDPIDVVLLDVALPDLDGFELHRCMRRLSTCPRVVFVTANDLVESGVAAVLDGAANYVVKRPNYLNVVVRVVGELLDDARAKGDWEPQDTNGEDSALIGESAAMKRVKELIEEFASVPATVLICGETGTGKELVARGLHEKSPCGHGPFVAVNCGALPEALLESELFGARRGAYTGSQYDRWGLVREAREGTLFLDEVAELPLTAQGKLLRLLESGQYRRIGGGGDLEANTRFIAATNRDLVADVRLGRFRSDLFFRLNVLRIDVPRLRDRRSDIPLLVRQFLREFHAEHVERFIQQSAWRQLIAGQWPGNVRELRHVVQRTVVRWRGGAIEWFDIDSDLFSRRMADNHREISCDRLREVLTAHGGRLGPVAEELGVSVRTVQRRMRAHRLELREFRSDVRDQ